METITGYVDHIVYRNGENGYTVFSLENENGEVTCVGNFNYINEGELLELEGEYVNHNIYGTQLRVSSHRVKEPEDLVSIERYLGSGAVKGVGAALAARIVRRFKEDTFRIIEEEPERLAEIKGISERKAREIAIQVEEKKEMRKAMLFLQKYGISTTLGVKIYEYYGAKLIRCWKKILISWRIILTESDLRRRMRLLHGSGFTRIPISGSGAVFSMCSSRLSERDTFICRRMYLREERCRFWEWRSQR